MARGYKDYGARDQDLFSIEQLNRTPVFQYEAVTLAASDDGLICQYVVPANYELYVVGGIITCNKPGFVRCVVGLTGTNAYLADFDTLMHINLPDTGILKFTESDTPKLHVYNDLLVAAGFHGAWWGYQIPILG